MTQSLQLVFLVAEDTISIKDIKLSAAEPPNDEPVGEYGDFWFEVHDQKGTTVYRHRVDSPLAALTAAAGTQPYEQFMLHVPVVHNGTIKLFGSVGDQSPAQPLGEFAL